MSYPRRTFIDVSRSIPASKLKAFRDWLMDAGRGEGTAHLYALNVETCARDDRGITSRLVASELAARAGSGALQEMFQLI